MNQAIKELLTRLKQRGFRKRSGSRATLFASLDQPALRPLPAAPFDLSEWSRARVNIDYHVAFDANFYSVPYPLVQQIVEVRSTPTTVEIFHRGQRVASHVRSRGTHQTISRNEHRPKSHQAHLAWTPSRMVQWAANAGPHTARLFERILASKPHPENGLSIVSGLDPAGRAVHTSAHGSRSGTGFAYRRLPLSACEVNVGEVTGSGTAA